MQHGRFDFWAQLGTVRFWGGCALLAATLGACGDEQCDTQQNCYYQSDGDAPECASLSIADCRRSGRCIVDSVCKEPVCSGMSCGNSCELVQVCVDN